MSVKKSKTKKLRSILESPFRICWPDKSKEELLPIQDALKKLLPAARLEISNLKTNLFQKKENEDKRNIKVKQENKYRNFLAPGYQSVIRGMEKKEICCAVFSNDVTPSLLLKVALTCAQTNSIPAIVIPDLKSITNSALGFSTMALGFKTVVAELTNNPFHTIFKMIVANPTIIELPMTTIPRGSFLKTNQSDHCVTIQKVTKMYQLNTENVYLYRKPNGKRAFVPSCNTETLHDGSLQTKNQDPLDFISLGEPKQRKSSDQKIKNKIIVKESYICDDDDDSDSNDGNIFFVDNVPDKSLFDKKSANVCSATSQENNLKFKRNKKNRRNKKVLRKTVSEFSYNSAQKDNSYLEDMNKYSGKKKNKPNQTSSNEVKFQPLSIKTVTFKPNKTKKIKNK